MAFNKVLSARTGTWYEIVMQGPPQSHGSKSHTVSTPPRGPLSTKFDSLSLDTTFSLGFHVLPLYNPSFDHARTRRRYSRRGSTVSPFSSSPEARLTIPCSCRKRVSSEPPSFDMIHHSPTQASSRLSSSYVQLLTVPPAPRPHQNSRPSSSSSAGRTVPKSVEASSTVNESTTSRVSSDFILRSLLGLQSHCGRRAMKLTFDRQDGDTDIDGAGVSEVEEGARGQG